MPLRNAITIAPVAIPLLICGLVFSLLISPSPSSSDGIVTGGFNIIFGDRDFNAPLAEEVPTSFSPEEVYVAPAWSRSSPLGAHADILIEKSPHRYEVPLGIAEREGWDYLDRGDRRAIDALITGSPAALELRIHSSGITKGALDTLQRYHTTTLQRTELYYDFVIGNGSTTTLGEIEIKPVPEEPALHTPSILHVCLVGDFDANRVPDSQLLALDELTAYLRAKVDHLTVNSHFDENNPHHTCLGLHFPVELVNESLNTKN